MVSYDLSQFIIIIQQCATTENLFNELTLSADGWDQADAAERKRHDMGFDPEYVFSSTSKQCVQSITPPRNSNGLRVPICLPELYIDVYDRLAFHKIAELYLKDKASPLRTYRRMKKAAIALDRWSDVAQLRLACELRKLEAKPGSELLISTHRIMTPQLAWSLVTSEKEKKLIEGTLPEDAMQFLVVKGVFKGTI